MESPLKISKLQDGREVVNQVKMQRSPPIRLKSSGLITNDLNGKGQYRLKDLHCSPKRIVNNNQESREEDRLNRQTSSNQILTFDGYPLKIFNNHSKSQLNSDFLISRQPTPRNQVQIQQDTQIRKSNLDLRQRILARLITEQINIGKIQREPLELEGKQFPQQVKAKMVANINNFNSNGVMKDSMAKRRLSQQNQTKEEIAQSNQVQPLTFKRTDSKDQIATSIQEICKKGGVNMNGNQKVLKKTIERYYKNLAREQSSEELIKLINQRRQNEIRGLIINKKSEETQTPPHQKQFEANSTDRVLIKDQTETQRSNSRTQIYKSLNQVIQKQKSHALLFKQPHIIKYEPLQESKQSLKVDSKEFCQLANSQRIFIQQKKDTVQPINAVKEVDEKAMSKNARKKFLQILEDMKLKLDVNQTHTSQQNQKEIQKQDKLKNSTISGITKQEKAQKNYNKQSQSFSLPLLNNYHQNLVQASTVASQAFVQAKY
eukprot:403372908